MIPLINIFEKKELTAKSKNCLGNFEVVYQTMNGKSYAV